jgi:hypothetical protein
MNIPIKIDTPELNEFDRIEAEWKRRSEARLVRAVIHSMQDYRERYGEPRQWTAEELAELKARREAEAREMADAMAANLVRQLLDDVERADCAMEGR